MQKLRAILLFAVLAIPTLAVGRHADQFNWEKLPPLPDHRGFSGMFSGVSNGFLLCMGGVQFHGSGGNLQKQWSNRIYVLEEGRSAWELANESLPVPLAYGVSATYGDRVIVAGGSSDGQHHTAVYSIRYKKGTVLIDTLAPLPVPLAHMTGALVGDHLLIAGGNTAPEGAPGTYFFTLNLASKAVGTTWRALDPWPGAARTHAVSASIGGRLFLFGGLGSGRGSGIGEGGVLRDAYRFSPHYSGGEISGGEWIELAEMPVGLAGGPSPAPSAGSDHILFVGGMTGIDPHPDMVEALYAYHAASNSWLSLGEIPEAERRIDAPVVKWGNQWVVIGGEQYNGATSAGAVALTKQVAFGWINWSALVVYLLFMIWIGYRFHHGDQTTDNFFTVGGKIPWWAAGISLFGAQISAITYMATPAIVYATDWSLAIGSVMILFTVPFVIKFYIPFFRRLSVTSAYEYLEHRFNRRVRVIGSLSFILFQLGRIGIVLFLPAIAISTVTGIDVYLLIFIMGIICIFYAVAGGMEAVIWTDVVQVIILIGGAVLCLVVATNSISGGLQGVLQKGMEADKFTLFHLKWDYDKPVLWVCVVGFFFLDIIPYTSDQTIVQRYLTVKDEKAAAKSLWTNAFIVLPSIIIFFGIGTVLYVFYADNPSAIPSEQVGEILPYFIVQELPTGIAGLVIAGIFAASQSALGAGMNSVSAAYVTDVHPQFRRVRNDRENLLTARIATVAVGLVGIGSAMLVAWLDVEFLFILFMEVLGILGGALAGVFILGIFTTRATSKGVIAGVATGVVAVWLAKGYTEMNSYLYGAVSVLSTVIGGYLASLLTQQRSQLENLTYFTRTKRGGWRDGE